MRWSLHPRDTSKWHWRHAWLPTRMDDGSWVWGEDYRARRVDVGHLWPEYKWQRHTTEEGDW